MAKVNKAAIESELRQQVFNDIINHSIIDFMKINDRTFGCILKDATGNERYVRVGVIVAQERNDVSARELMMAEIREYEEKQKVKEEKKND